MLQAGWPLALGQRGSLLGLPEMPQVRRRLVLARRHQIAVGAQQVILLADEDVLVVLAAGIFEPDRRWRAAITAHHHPRPRQSMVDGGDLVAQHARSVGIEEDALLHDRLVVLVQRYVAVEGAWAAQRPGLRHQRVVAAVTVAVLPMADRIAREGGRDLRRP